MTANLSRVFAVFLAFACVTATAPALAAARCTKDCGRVQSVRHVVHQGEASGLGAVAGGVLGGVIGHQFGSGRGNTAATIAGATGGAYAGHEIEKNRNRRSYWAVSVRMDSGKTRTLTFGSPPAVREGERVKLVNGGRRLVPVRE